LLKKFNIAELKPVSTPMSSATTLDMDENGEAMDQTEYTSMIDSLLYLMATWPDIQFTVCLCACFQAFPMHFTSASYLTDFEVSQIHTRIWDLVLHFICT
jgi:hypothetical protein